MQQTTHIFEAVSVRSKYLQNIDTLFAELKTDYKKRKSICKKISREIENFLNNKVPVTFEVSTKYPVPNAFTLPVMKKKFAFDFASRIQKVPKSIKTAGDTILDNPKYIKSIYIAITKKAIDISTPQELTAVLLHEIGHAFQHVSQLSRYATSFLVKLIFNIQNVSTIRTMVLIPSIISKLLPLLLTTCLISYSISFLNRKEEHDADYFAVKYGYGDDLLSFLDKISPVKKSFEESKFKKWVKKVFRFIIDAVLPTWAKEHPEQDERAQHILSAMKKDFYDDYKDILNKNQLLLYVDQFTKR